MNRNELKTKLFRAFKFIYRSAPDTADRILIDSTEGRIQFQPFFVNRKTMGLDEYLNTAIDWVMLNDVDNSWLQRIVSYDFELPSNLTEIPAEYATTIRLAQEKKYFTNGLKLD